MFMRMIWNLKEIKVESPDHDNNIMVPVVEVWSNKEKPMSTVLHELKTTWTRLVWRTRPCGTEEHAAFKIKTFQYLTTSEPF